MTMAKWIGWLNGWQGRQRKVSDRESRTSITEADKIHGLRQALWMGRGPGVRMEGEGWLVEEDGGCVLGLVVVAAGRVRGHGRGVDGAFPFQIVPFFCSLPALHRDPGLGDDGSTLFQYRGAVPPARRPAATYRRATEQGAC